MDVELYVYDLSRGMARQYSMAIAGVQIDAIYHTAIVMGGVEYFFGQGVHRKVPGSTHHGRPMKIVKLGQTQLPSEVIQEYIISLESIYTPESYDLFVHNCNNFSQDLAMFLVGKDIPEEIRTLPETFLRTPIGQMLRGQIDQSMRQMTQAPDAVSGQDVPNVKPQPQSLVNGTNNKLNGYNSLAAKAGPVAFLNGEEKAPVPGHVHNVTSTSDLDRLLRAAEKNCAVIFFTSASCPPCKIVYPAYDELAAEASDKATLIKIDTSVAYDAARRYSIRATPTFITFLKGKQEEEWSGAHEARLRGNVRLLIQTANPQHPHMSLRLPSFKPRIQKPIMYIRTPPLDKLVAKLGPAGQDKAIQDLTSYIRTRDSSSLANAPIPNLQSLSSWLSTTYTTLPPESHFALIDLIRISTSDPRISSYLTTEPSHLTLFTLLPTDPNKDYSTLPYNLQAVSLQFACNLFSSPLFQESLFLDSQSALRPLLQNLASTSLLSSHANARSLAAALAYNLAAYDHNERLSGSSSLSGCLQSSIPDLEAALIEALVSEAPENKDTLRALLLALGTMLMCAETDSSAWELCEAMDVREALAGKRAALKGKERADVELRALLGEVGEELLGKGKSG